MVKARCTLLGVGGARIGARRMVPLQNSKFYGGNIENDYSPSA